MTRSRARCMLPLAILCVVGFASRGVAVAAQPSDEVVPARVFSDHMVLPCDRPVPVWGTAPPGRAVRVRFADTDVRVEANAEGQWRATLPPMAASVRPRELMIDDRAVRDVLVGEVWYCAGQSNMRWRLDQSRGGEGEMEAAGELPHLRLLDLTTEWVPTGRTFPADRLRAVNPNNYYEWSGWQRASPTAAASFSAVAWHFGRRALEIDPAVPIGLIHTAVGGTPMESWISRTELKGDPELRALLDRPWYEEGHPRFPAWCGQRARRNLASYLAQAPDAPSSDFSPPHAFAPSFLFDAGVRPFLSFPVTGVLWYQGESNATAGGAGAAPIDAEWNRRLFTTLIRSWRAHWNQLALPFCFAQLPGLNRAWSPFRAMQRQVALTDPHAFMAVTIDVGHPTDVHPIDKRPVGRRLAEVARGVARSPQVQSLDPKSVVFDQPVRTADGKPVRGFALAGEDRIFQSANATIVGTGITLRSDRVDRPVAVRYGWENDPDLNLVGVNGGHPVSPFRSDRWDEADQHIEVAQRADRVDTALLRTGFESAPTGPLTRATFDGMTWTAPEGHAVINAKLPRTGRHCLHLRGGEHSEVTFELPRDRAVKRLDSLTFAAERWTARAPFRFRVEVATTEGGWREIYHGDRTVEVGRAYRNQVKIRVPERARRFRFTCVAPLGTGILIDDLSFVEAIPMEVVRVIVPDETYPVFIGDQASVLLPLEVETRGSQSPLRLRGAKFVVTEGASAVAGYRFAEVDVKGGQAEFEVDVDVALESGRNRLSLTCELGATASLDGFVAARCLSVRIGDRTIELPAANSARRRIGVALRRAGEGGVHTYRIPGITTTPAGTLVAVYDHRYRSSGDLPGDIDVAVSRSTDGGRTWTPSRVIMDMGNDPRWNFDGVGDPAILTDRVTGTIWVAATWSHGNRSWRGSGPGLTPEETGQLLLVKSLDDGKTWSKPINITRQVKDPKWRFVLQGPGNGITLKDGTLVFPAQYRGEDADPINGKPFSTIITSRDRGETWQIGRGVKIDTTEAQVVQLGDGSIMINCRDNRGGARSVYTTSDLGYTWIEHPTSRRALPEPVCNAGLLRVEHPEFGPLLVFSNPNTTRGRHHFTLKVSDDEGMTWPTKWHTLYDERPGYGYSVLTPVGDDHVGVLWEGRGDLYYLRFGWSEIVPRP